MGRDSKKIVTNIPNWSRKHRGRRPSAAGPSVLGSFLECWLQFSWNLDPSRLAAQIAKFGMLVTIFVESRPAAQIAQFGVLVAIFVELNYFPWTPQSPTPFPIMALGGYPAPFIPIYMCF